VGPGPIFSESNDTGPDDANHDHDGIFILSRIADLRGGSVSGRRTDADCLDITPTILDFFGMSSSDQMRGKSLLSELKENGPRVALEEPEPYGAKEAQGAQKGFSTEEEEMVKEQLKNLGYI
jgi:arylsulfatase A-like enzyme